MLAGLLTASVPGPDPLHDSQSRPALVVREITMPNSNIETLLMIFVGITAVAVLLQACVLLGIFLTVRKAVHRGQDQADVVRAKLIPFLDISKELMESGKDVVNLAKDLIKSADTLIANLEPRLETAATELADMAHDVHLQANRLQASVDEVAGKARRQADRVDQMATSTLNGLDRFGSFVNSAVNLPVRQLSGVIAAARAVVGTMRAPASPRPRRAPQPAPVAEDKDLFV
jgi:methyl-accepting chemotaxis protein